ncbi:hypothetical protein IPJ72_02180 [Candidatus Peregrinibacteria bacterium]|nr:MAG: hypothetical protein IPJ72_02180 [Candidatus Peregrinibacteria bacterium]
METVLELLPLWKTPLLAAHILGTTLGLGGATISDILFFKFLTDYRISKKESEVMQVMKNIVLGGMFLLVVTGIGLFGTDPALYKSSDPFLFKTTLAIILVLNGVALHVWVAPRLIRFNLAEHRINRYWHKLAFLLGSISFVTWYSVFFTAMFKKSMPWDYPTLLLVYLTILLIAIACGQGMERYLTIRAKRH